MSHNEVYSSRNENDEEVPDAQTKICFILIPWPMARTHKMASPKGKAVFPKLRRAVES